MKNITGDTLRAVGSQSTEYKSLAQLSEMILGPMGSAVVLHLRGESGEYAVKLERRGINGSDQVSQFYKDDCIDYRSLNFWFSSISGSGPIMSAPCRLQATVRISL